MVSAPYGACVRTVGPEIKSLMIAVLQNSTCPLICSKTGINFIIIKDGQVDFVLIGQHIFIAILQGWCTLCA